MGWRLYLSSNCWPVPGSDSAALLAAWGNLDERGGRRQNFGDLSARGQREVNANLGRVLGVRCYLRADNGVFWL